MAVMAQWQSTGGSSQCHGFDSRRLTAFFIFLYFCLIIFIFSMRQDALSIHDKRSVHKHWKLSQSQRQTNK